MESASNVRYTLWSRGRLLGDTDLGFVFRLNGVRCGWLYPTTLGDRLLPIATGVGPALRTLCMIGPDPTAQADLQSAVDEERALSLELRGPDGSLIATEDIGVIDTHYLQELARAELPEDNDEPLDPEEEAEIQAIIAELDAAEEMRELDPSTEEEDSDLPRYQIQVHLIDPQSVP